MEDIRGNFKDFDDLRWELVCQVKVDTETETQDIAKKIVRMLCDIDIFVPGDQFQAAKVGDFICIIKAYPYISIEEDMD